MCGRLNREIACPTIIARVNSFVLFFNFLRNHVSLCSKLFIIFVLLHITRHYRRAERCLSKVTLNSVGRANKIYMTSIHTTTTTPLLTYIMLQTSATARQLLLYSNIIICIQNNIAIFARLYRRSHIINSTANIITIDRTPRGALSYIIQYIIQVYIILCYNRIPIPIRNK